MGVRNRAYDKGCPDSIGLTLDDVSTTMALVLFKKQPKSNQQLLDDFFAPLLEGKPVVLQVNDPRLVKKRRVGKAPMLMLVPTEVFGGRGKLMVSLQAHGCEILDINTDLKLISFLRVGLNSKLSNLLAQQLKRIYHGD